MAKCKHPSDSISARWVYTGDKLTSGAGYCRDCDEPHRYCVKAKKLVPEDEVIEPLDWTEKWWLLRQETKRRAAAERAARQEKK